MRVFVGPTVAVFFNYVDPKQQHLTQMQTVEQ